MSDRTLAGGGLAIAIVAVIAATVVVATVTGASEQDNAPTTERPHTITVTATETISAKPDEAVVMLRVHTENADSVVALSENSRIMNDVIAAMAALGIAQKDLETTNIGLSPETINRGTSAEATIFNASTSLEVKIHDFDVIGPAIQKGVRAGATSVKGVRFQVADPVAVKTRALRAAVESARAKADALAGAAGTAVTGVIRIHEGGSPTAPQPYFVGYRNLAYDAAALTVVPPREVTSKVSVQVVWSIG